ncbi:hypothetical protein ACFQPG_10560 [Sphingomonas sp. GCM10030256]|uniref:hypothetical protein n=1 Tax=Sphingomonas sp. GCM10030256 TaxID=3273427 RepID=UPI00361B13FD
MRLAGTKLIHSPNDYDRRFPAGPAWSLRQDQGLTLDLNDRRQAYFVIDIDDENTLSRIFHAVVSEDMLDAKAAPSIDALHQTKSCGPISKQ